MSKSAGLHVIMDLYVNDASVFEPKKLNEMFYKLVDLLEMKMLRAPEFIEVEMDPEILKRVEETGEFADEGGVTAFCVINTSHLSIHTWGLQKFASLDLFSCKDFDHEKAISFVKEFLDCSKVNVHVVERFKPA